MSFRREIEERQDKGPVIKLFGELDIYTSTDFKDEVLEILEKYKDNIYLDLKDLEYIDSTGLGSLIALVKTAKEIDKKVYLKDVNERIRKLFKITALEDMFIFVGGIND
ncbi:MAG: STAS domain-containing protein [Bacillota bacterium]|nr:STAS domain-containing protein [Bacillota bacterium]